MLGSPSALSPLFCRLEEDRSARKSAPASLASFERSHGVCTLASLQRRRALQTELKLARVFAQREHKPGLACGRGCWTMIPVAADAFITARVTSETKALMRGLAERQGVTESRLLKDLIEVTLRNAGTVLPAPPPVRVSRSARLAVRLHPEDWGLLKKRARDRRLPSATYVSLLVQRPSAEPRLRSLERNTWTLKRSVPRARGDRPKPQSNSPSDQPRREARVAGIRRLRCHPESHGRTSGPFQGAADGQSALMERRPCSDIPLTSVRTSPPNGRSVRDSTARRLGSRLCCPFSGTALDSVLDEEFLAFPGFCRVHLQDAQNHCEIGRRIMGLSASCHWPANVLPRHDSEAKRGGIIGEIFIGIMRLPCYCHCPATDVCPFDGHANAHIDTTATLSK